MEEKEWQTKLENLNEASDMVSILGRCLAVQPQLEAWRTRRDEFHGTDAANALDQALGALNYLAAGKAADLVVLVESIMVELPTPWE